MKERKVNNLDKVLLVYRLRAARADLIPELELHPTFSEGR